MKIEHKIWCNGSGDLQPLLTEVQSPLWVQLLFLIADYKTFFDLSFLRHYIDIVQISLFSLKSIPFWDSLGDNQQVRRQCSYLTPTRCSKVHAFMIPVIFPSASGLRVYNKAIIPGKTWKIIMNTVSWYMLFFQVLFLWNFSRLWKYIIRNSHSSNPLQYSCLENLMDRGAWQAIVHSVASKSRTWLKRFSMQECLPSVPRLNWRREKPYIQGFY